MNHFSIWQWVDFARGLGTDETSRAMEAHLGAGCSRCDRVVKLLRGIVATAKADGGYEPPERAIRYARALYSLHRPETVSLPRLIGRLVLDTGLAPLPAGMRAQGRSTRHLLYEAGDYYLDVQVQKEPGSATVGFVGQLTDRSGPATSTANLPIWLVEGESLVASTVSNPLGEFQLECPATRNLQLRVPLPAAGRRLEVSLRHVTDVPSRGRNAALRPAARKRRRS